VSGISDKVKPELLKTHELLLAIAAAALMLLPFVISVSDAVNSFISQFQGSTLLQNLVAPMEARMIAVVLQHLFGIPTVISGSTLIMMGQPSLKVYVSWICVGWQSAVLYAATVLVGLRGPYTTKSKLLVLFAGIEGTFLINLLRETSVILVNMYLGELAAILYHDYGGTIILITWLVLFWYLVYAFVLRQK
jgi:exosortase/archaeosortase family protein